jgi:hypothetical protein
VLDVEFVVVCLQSYHPQMKETASTSRVHINPEPA